MQFFKVDFYNFYSSASLKSINLHLGIYKSALTRKHCIMTTAAANILRLSFDKLGLSARAYDKVLRVARTIADLDGSDVIDTKHIAEAVQYRSLDRKFWKE